MSAPVSGRGSLVRAVAFLTVVGTAAEPEPGALLWFPAVGAALGLVVGGTWWGAARLWPAAVAAGLAVAVDLGITGLLHFDGLCDAADGLLPPLARERRLDVMRSPTVGAFGAGTAIITMLLRWLALASITPRGSAVLLVAGLWAVSRTAMAVALIALPYARDSGLASAFRDGSRRLLAPLALVGALGAALLAATWRPGVGPLSVLAAGLAAATVVALGWRRLDGFTGDVLGAAGMVGETVGLLAACARW